MNKVNREQVSPTSYKVKDHREMVEHKFAGKFKRDNSSRLNSCRLYLPTRDITPSPHDYVATKCLPDIPRTVKEKSAFMSYFLSRSRESIVSEESRYGSSASPVNKEIFYGSEL